MTEKTITDKILAKLKERGFFTWKQHGGPMQQAGLPDIFAVHGGRLHAIEVKRRGGQTTKLQARTLEKLAAVGAFVACVNSWEELESQLPSSRPLTP